MLSASVFSDRELVVQRGSTHQTAVQFFRGRMRRAKRIEPQGFVHPTPTTLAKHATVHFAVGITNSAPFAIVSGHLCITLFCLV